MKRSSRYVRKGCAIGCGARALSQCNKATQRDFDLARPGILQEGQGYGPVAVRFGLGPLKSSQPDALKFGFGGALPLLWLPCFLCFEQGVKDFFKILVTNN